ncbi:MAG TPA: S41 family peptidase [Chloroflexia bacterium]|nr:S41 family peptidase [Chloroflexia bacterium]
MDHKQKQNQKLTKLWLALLLSISLLLTACGSNKQTLVVTPNPSITASVQLPPASVAVGDGASTTDQTSTPVIAGTTTAGNDLANSGAAATAPALPQVTPTPTPAGAAEKIDRQNELKVVKAAYDAINQHLFRVPDTSALLTAALTEVGRTTGATAPMVQFDQNQESNWTAFSTAFNKMLDSVPDFKYPKNQLAHRVVNAMAEQVNDEHTYFLDPASFQSRENLLSGNNTTIGFGVVITTENGKAYIVRVVPNSPADKSGMKAGDQIIEYDGQPISDKNWSLIKNASENETHKFVLSRIGTANQLTVSVTKQEYTLPTVEYRLINNHIGYIAIRDFFLNVADETDKAMQALYKQGADSWIIDVRENPGGVNVEQVTGRFVQGGEIMGYNTSRTNREPQKVSNDLAGGPDKGKPFSPLLPLVLLQDDVSASSSEMLALAVHDFNLGPLIGVKTAGALGHTAAYPLGDGSAISVTVDVYESRSGLKVNGIGVSPDIQVERSIEDLVSGNDPQLKAGVQYLEKLIAKK